MKDVMSKSEYFAIREMLQVLENGDNKARAKARRIEKVILRYYDGVLCYNNVRRTAGTACYILPFPFSKL